jgi:iron(III) transport system permease protein
VKPTPPARDRAWDGERIALAVLVAFTVLLLGAPFLRLFAAGLSGEGGLSLTPLAEAATETRTLLALRRSLETSLASAAIALVLGGAYALVLGLTDIRGKAAFVFLIVTPMMIPPHVTAIAWTQAMGPSSVLLRSLGIAPAPGAEHPLYSAGGIIALLSIQHAPLVLLVIRAGLRAMPRETVESARVCGAGPGRILRRVLLPMLAPHLAAAFMLAFVSGLGNFGIPALLGIPAGYSTLPVLIYERLASFGPTVLRDVAVLATIMGGVAVAAALVQRRLERGLALAVVYLVLAALFSTALVSTYGVTLTWETLTFANFREVLLEQSVTLRSFANSLTAAGAAALVLAALAIPLGYFAAFRRGRGVGAALALADIAYALPGLVLSIALILIFVHPLPGLDATLYGTLAVIFVAYLIRFMAVAAKPVVAACSQLDRSLDEAARLAGAGLGRRLRRVFAPAVAPSAASAAILVFMTAYNEVTVSALLWSSGSETIGTVIFNFEDGGYTALAAAMAGLTVVATGALMAALTALSPRLPAGTIPWRD